MLWFRVFRTGVAKEKPRSDARRRQLSRRRRWRPALRQQRFGQQLLIEYVQDHVLARVRRHEVDDEVGQILLGRTSPLRARTCRRQSAFPCSQSRGRDPSWLGKYGSPPKRSRRILDLPRRSHELGNWPDTSALTPLFNSKISKLGNLRKPLCFTAAAVSVLSGTTSATAARTELFPGTGSDRRNNGRDHPGDS